MTAHLLLGMHKFYIQATRFAFFALVSFQNALPVAAETSTYGDNATQTSRDAFGERIGQDQIGLYTEQEVRGFNLATTASYRLEDHYFMRESQLPNAVIEGVSVKVGVTAARLKLPSPSGVIDYRLRKSSAGDRSITISSGVRENLSPTVELISRYGHTDQFSVATGIEATRNQYGNRTKGYSFSGGMVPKFTLSERSSIRGIVSFEYQKLNGDFQFAVPRGYIPITLGRRNYGVPWADIRRHTINSGILFESQISPNWSLSATTFYADNVRSPAELTLVGLRPDNQTADITYIDIEKARNLSISWEATASYKAVIGQNEHSFSSALRGRHSSSFSSSQLPFSVGVINLKNPVYPARPFSLSPVGELRSNVTQELYSLGYYGNYAQTLEIKLGAHLSNYSKTVTAPSGLTTQRRKTQLLYDVSTIWAITPTLTVFADVVKGQEESGIAPQNASNRFEILPAVISTQYEFGLRQVIANELFLNIAGFDTSKLSPGFSAAGKFDLLGKLRHRGLELSLAGKVFDSANIVIGTLAMRPRLTSDSALAGVVGSRPVGVSSTKAFSAISVKTKLAPNWTFDQRIAWQGGRAADPTNTYRTKGFFIGSLGARYDFQLRHNQAQLRFLVSNLFGNGAFVVNPSGLLTQSSPISLLATFRITL